MRNTKPQNPEISTSHCVVCVRARALQSYRKHTHTTIYYIVYKEHEAEHYDFLFVTRLYK